MATSRCDLTSDEIMNVKCCVCIKDNRTREAENYCLECKDYLCSSCVGLHNKFSSMKAHTVIDKSSFKSTRPDESLPSYPTLRCPLHKTELVNMYCKDHDDVTCASCIALSLSHRSCKSMVSIIEEIDNLYQNQNIGEIKEKIIEVKNHLVEIKTIKEARIQDLKVALITEIESVKAFKQELQTLLDNTEEETVEELKRETKRIEETLLKDMSEIESLVSSINEAVSQLQNAGGNKAQEFVCVKSSKRILEKGENVTKIHEHAADETVYIESDQSNKAYLLKIKRLGKITTKKPVNWHIHLKIAFTK